MIDLDAPDETPRNDPRRTAPENRWRRLVAASALLAVGAGLGGAVAYRWQEQRSREAGPPAVILLAAPVAGLVDGTSTAIFDAGVGASTLVEFPVDLMVANVSAAPLTVRELSVNQPGLSLSSSLSDRWLEPGKASLSKAALRVDCAAGYPVGTLRATLSVETDDGARRTRALAVTFDGSSWNQRVESACSLTG